ncbi:MAG: DNA polymerase III subunit beta [Candidatus Nealsonbacteria bacterium RBG_13_38_11]|uniref:Beta sliding clamp n=1 Tax=Candidatus Nealsonbacteria bacterium RBG_13_38_11 TaxID=1801662 RepID=A0A1G2DZQ4_9BACT|nr:MAG: DNA polymerase III subunit beta [Candidatus Nealsonbacteria bacterium RBG_13_38_11]
MKITVLKDKLKEGIGIVEKVSARSANLPILNNILISAEKNFLSLTATDLEIGIKWWALVKTEKEGQIAIPSKILSSLVSFLPNKSVNLEIKGFDLKIDCENYQTTLKGVDPEDFPIIPKVSTEEKVEIPIKKFCQGLGSVVDIASLSSTKPEISGVYFLFQKNTIVMAATDSFRLGEKKIYLDSSNDVSKEYSFILPQRAAKEIINIFSEKEGTLIIYFSPNQVLFETKLSEVTHPQIQLTSRLVEGDYPSYQEIIPKKYETRVSFSLDEFINQIKLASLFSGKINEIRLKIDSAKNRINFFSQNPDVGEYNSFLPGRVEGKSCEISFNHRFLLDGLLNIGLSQQKKSEAALELTGSEKPGVLRLKGDESYLYLVMPIKNS